MIKSNSVFKFESKGTFTVVWPRIRIYLLNNFIIKDKLFDCLLDCKLLASHGCSLPV